MKNGFRIAGYCLHCALRHPRTKITIDDNPVSMELSPIPWWGSVLILIIGITSWVISTYYSIEGLAEAARAMVYCPLMHIFDMSWFLTRQVKEHKNG